MDYRCVPDRFLKDYHLGNKMKYRLPSFVVLAFISIISSDGIGFSLCIFQNMFGFSCPACGLTRSMSSLLRLDVLKSFSYHPLGFIILGFILLCLLTNYPGYLGSKNKVFKQIFSFKLMTLLFIVVWLLRTI